MRRSKKKKKQKKGKINKRDPSLGCQGSMDLRLLGSSSRELLRLLLLRRRRGGLHWNHDRNGGGGGGGGRWGSRRRRLQPAVDAGGALGLDPSFDVVLAAAEDPSTGAEPPDHTGDDAEDGNDGQDADQGPHGPAAVVRRRVQSHSYRRRRRMLLQWQGRHCRRREMQKGKKNTDPDLPTWRRDSKGEIFSRGGGGGGFGGTGGEELEIESGGEGGKP